MRYWPILTITVLALVIRLVALGSIPPSLNWDEVSHGYNAYSVLRTGTDEWGKIPIANFRAYGDYPLPVNMYLTVPVIAVLGLNEVVIRLPSAVFGGLTVLIVYLIGKRIFENERTSLLAAFLLALSPWSFFTSRQTLQADSAMFFYCVGMWLFLKAMQEKYLWLIPSVISFCVAAYSYHNTRILLPLIVPLLLLIYFKRVWSEKRITTIALFVTFVLCLPIAMSILSKEGTARAAWVGIIDQGAINRINEQRGASQLPGPLPRLVHNKVTYVASIAAQNYFSYFSPQYLGVKGGQQYQFSVPDFGVINLAQLPFFYVGLFLLLYSYPKNSLEKKLLLSLLLIGPIPAAITKDPYQVVRTMTMMPFVFLVSSYGFFKVLRSVRHLPVIKYGLAGLTAVVFTIVSVHYFYTYFFQYPTQYSIAWQYGYKQAAAYIIDNQKDYQTVVMSKYYGEPHEFFLFYTGYDPAKYKTDLHLNRYTRSDWFWVDGFDKYQFVNDWEVVDKTQTMTNTLLVTRPGNYPPHAQKITTIEFLNGQPAFDIVKL